MLLNWQKKESIVHWHLGLQIAHFLHVQKECFNLLATKLRLKPENFSIGFSAEESWKLIYF